MPNPSDPISRETLLKLAEMNLDRFKSLARRKQLPFLDEEDFPKYARTGYTVEKAALLAVQRSLMDGDGISPDAAKSMAGNLKYDAFRCGWRGSDWFGAAFVSPVDLWLVSRVCRLEDGEILSAGREFGPLAEATAKALARGDEPVVRLNTVNVSEAVRRVVALLGAETGDDNGGTV